MSTFTWILLILAKSFPFQPFSPALLSCHEPCNQTWVQCGGYFSSRILLKRWKDHIAFLSSSLKLRGNSWTSGKYCFFGTFHTKRKMDDLEALHFLKTGNVLFSIIKCASEEPEECTPSKKRPLTQIQSCKVVPSAHLYSLCMSSLSGLFGAKTRALFLSTCQASLQENCINAKSVSKARKVTSGENTIQFTGWLRMEPHWVP